MITKQTFCAFGTALFVWGALMVGITRLPDAAPAALVMFPSMQFITALPPDVRIIEYTSFSVTLASNQRDPNTLYALGALIVLPAGLTGCLPEPLSNTAT